jgi:hypothetical protein
MVGGWETPPLPRVSLDDKRFAGWRGIARASNLRFRNTVRRPPDAVSTKPVTAERLRELRVILSRLGNGMGPVAREVVG